MNIELDIPEELYGEIRTRSQISNNSPRDWITSAIVEYCANCPAINHPVPDYQFDKILEEAAKAIRDDYVFLRMADHRKGGAHRERVYCYEFYHQLRRRLGQVSQYQVAGEIDKAGVRNEVEDLKPDLVVHQPGNHLGNYSVFEVKPWND